VRRAASEAFSFARRVAIQDTRRASEALTYGTKSTDVVSLARHGIDGIGGKSVVGEIAGNEGDQFLDVVRKAWCCWEGAFDNPSVKDDVVVVDALLRNMG
jgi:hypothetical protein